MLSKITFILCAVAMFYASFVFYPRWKQPGAQAAIAWDVSGYYWYLPSLFIYKDIKKQSFKDSILEKYQPTGTDFQQGFMHESGNYVMKYSSGMAVMYLPFFAVAHVVATPLGYEADGFSAPYQLAIQLGGLLVALVGLWYLRKFLLLFYSEAVTAICIFLMAIGTNFLNYGAIDVGMSHGWLFTVYVFILISTYRFYQRPSYKYAIAIGLLCGLATLTRPTDIISVLIPLLWGLEGLSPASIKKQFAFLVKNIRFLGASFLCGALVFSIQLIYWKYATGHWLVYSYEDQGFTWLHPHFKKYLISAHNGWLAYAPVMFFAFFGLVTLWRREKFWVAVTAFVLLDLYLVASWEFYWYGGRFMVQAYPVLLLPMASFMEWMLERKWRKILVTPVLLLCLYIGLWTVIQYHYGGLYDWDMSNRQYYLATLGRWNVPEETFKLKDTDELFSGKPKQQVQIYYNDFDTDTTGCSEQPINGKRSICLSGNRSNADYFVTYSSHDKQWLRAEATFHCQGKEWNVWNMTQFIVSFQHSGKDIKTRSIRVYRFLNDGDTKTVFIDTKVPKEDFDQVKVSFWHVDSKQTLVIDDLKLYSFNGDQ